MIRTAAKYFPVGLILLAVCAGGCDSDNGDAGSLDEAFVGDWVLVGVEDDTGDRYGEVTDAYHQISLTMQDGGGAVIAADGIDDADDLTVAGSYAVSEPNGTLTLTLTVSGVGEIPLTFAFEFTGSDSIRLTATGLTVTALNAVLGASLAGSTEMTFDRD